jgi:uncharacterized membrane protein
MSPLTATLAGLLVLAASVWIGGFVAIAVVSRVADGTLSAEQRIAFFRRLGRSYAKVGVSALVAALAIGAVLLTRRPFDGRAGLAVGFAAVLLVTAVTGMIQARRMGTLRRQALESADNALLAAKVRRGVRLATALRAGIGLATLGLLAAGVWIAT